MKNLFFLMACSLLAAGSAFGQADFPSRPLHYVVPLPPGAGADFIARTVAERLAEEGYTTLSIQLPVLPSTAILGLYVPLYPDARERFQLAVDFLKAKGHKNIGIVSHSLGATMANQYLIRTEDTSVRAWVFVGILQGLEEMYRIKIPTLDVYGSNDWTVTMSGAPEREKQLKDHPGSAQVMVPDAKHFFEGKEDELVRITVSFLDATFKAKP